MNNDVSTLIHAFIIDSLLLGKQVDLSAVPSFLEAGIIDSTGVLELVQFVEETFGVSVADEEMVPENLDSLASLAAFVGRKTQKAA